MSKRPASEVADDDFAELITKYGAEEGMANAFLVVEVPIVDEEPILFEDYSVPIAGKRLRTAGELNETQSKEIEIPVIKELLMASSPVFRTMFTSRFKESKTKRVNLKGKSLEQVQIMLDYMYPEKSPILTDSIAALVLPLAHEYEIRRLKNLCVQTLGEMSSPRLEYITLANRFDLPDLLHKSINTCVEELSLVDIEREEVLEVNQDLPEKYVNKIIRQKLHSIRQPISKAASSLKSYDKSVFSRGIRFHRTMNEDMDIEKRRVEGLSKAAATYGAELLAIVSKI